MSPQTWGTDDELLTELKDALHTAGHLQAGTDAGYAAWASRTGSGDFHTARLNYDSYLDEAPALRGTPAAQTRILIFQGPDQTSLEVEVVGDQLIGQLVPPLTADIVLLLGDGVEIPTVTDDLGCFNFSLPDGVFRLKCLTPTTALITEWVRL